jgi:cyclopropane-fatty-acyl-phospholipid synthase
MWRIIMIWATGSTIFFNAKRQYFCTYWAEEVTSLEEAQLAKMDHIAAKLALAPGMRVLDIGYG